MRVPLPAARTITESGIEEVEVVLVVLLIPKKLGPVVQFRKLHEAFGPLFGTRQVAARDAQWLRMNQPDPPPSGGLFDHSRTS